MNFYFLFDKVYVNLKGLKHILYQGESSMENPHESIVLKSFKKKKVMTIDELTKRMHCSIPTVRRRLKQWHTYTSYNKNGSYYVLKESAKFDQNGLWRYRDILFSHYGNLKETIMHLVQSSQSGLAGVEIGRLIGLSPRSFLSHFRNALPREKINGQFIYFSMDEECALRQKQNRQESSDRSKDTEFLTDAQAVVLLVERIKHPKLSIEELSHRLSQKGHPMKPPIIRSFFDSHGLLKKTQDIP